MLLRSRRTAKGTAEEPGSKFQTKAGLNWRVLAQKTVAPAVTFPPKAEQAGREFVEGNPRSTSQR